MTRLLRPLRDEIGRAASVLQAAFGLESVEDLLRHYPRRYAEPGQLTDIAQLVEGELATVVARVVEVTTRRLRDGKRQLVEVEVTDGTSTLILTFFFPHAGFAANLTRRLPIGCRAMFAGKVETYRGTTQLVQPDYEPIVEEFDEFEVAARAEQFIAIYPATAKMPSWRIATAIRTLLDTLRPQEVPDPLPEAVRTAWGLPDLWETFQLIHRPRSTGQLARARARLRYEEAFVLQLALARRRQQLSVLPATAYPPRPQGLLDAFDAALPFPLTDGQHEVGRAISADLGRFSPMNRLLQGEVGSGKTIVALRAMLQVVDAGAQCALLAPTEVLAAQHHRSLTAHLGALAGGGAGATTVALLTGSQPASARRAALAAAAGGEAGIVVGTHALLQEAVEFADLGLAIIDEQHRFGVEQRDALRNKAGTPPHVLVMTATPIPRTVAMTVFGDLDVSTLAELPPGRQPVQTIVVPAQAPKWINRCWERVREEVDAGRQVYVVCPRIGGDDETAPAPARAKGSAPGAVPGSVPPSVPPETLFEASSQELAERMAAAMDVLEQLRAEPALRGVRLGLLHGRLPGPEKEAVMLAFAAGEIDVLVATTVVEVGVDVPNASTMVIMDADRFGLSQLHQLRGRVGRGLHPGLAFFVSSTEDPARQQRLAEVAATTDGFAVADLDLATRREGDVLGSAQSGRRSSLRLLRVTRDEVVITRARADAAALIAEDPELLRHPLLLVALASLDAEREAYLERG